MPSRPAPPRKAAPRDAGQQQPPPVFRTGINFVRVDVIVTDSKTGQPVADLKQSDFQVTEDNKPQTLETFKLIKLDGGRVPGPDGPPQAIRSDEDEELEAARDDVRLFAIFLDDYHTRRGASVSVREPIAKFISTQLGPSDMVGLMYPLQPVSSVRMTRDHDRIIRGLASFVGRKGDYTPKNRMEEQYANYPAETVELIRNQVSLSALKGLITHMGSLKEGRKALILVSEGYSNTLPPQLRDPVASVPGLDNPERGDPQAGLNDPNEERRQFFDDSTMSLTLRDVWDLANKNNVAIYAVDPRGLPVSEFDVSQPTMSAQVDRQYLNATMDTLQDAGPADRRPRHRQSQRSGDRHDADRSRHERVLPARLQLDAGAVGREVPRDQSAGEAARHSGARAEGLLGADDRRRRARAGPEGRSRPRAWRTRSPRSARRPLRTTRSGPGSARRAAQTARPR